MELNYPQHKVSITKLKYALEDHQIYFNIFSIRDLY